MGIQHTNRSGQVYYLQVKQTPTGRTAYAFARKLTGTAVEVLPEGYEVFEDPETAQVHLRKIRPSSITPAERELLENTLRKLAPPPYCRVVVDRDSLVVYTTDDDPDRMIDENVESPSMLSSRRREELRTWILGRAHYSRMLRFTVADTETRAFTVERWCFRGSIDDWIFLGGPAPLADLARATVPRLGKESFFDLM